MNKTRTALISVYNKEGITEFAQELIKLGFKILASGGTAKHLKDGGVEVEDVANLVGGGPILGHRVVTLSREVHAGLLAQDNAEDRKELEDLKIPFIDLVCVDMYPLQEEVMNPNATSESVIEKTDVGGPAMLRSAAKGRRIAVCRAEDRMKVIEWLKAGEPERESFLNNLAAETEFYIARYVATSAYYHSGGKLKSIFGTQAMECAYGENAYQTPAGLYNNSHGDVLGLSEWKLVGGSAPSYNNFCDLDRLIQTITHIGAGFQKNFGEVSFAAVGGKHGNACGASVASSEVEAVEKMLQGDLRAIFGGSVIVNFPVTEEIAEVLINKFMPEGQRRLLDVVAAPSFTPEAIEILSRKKGKCRLVENKNILKSSSLDMDTRLRYVRGGFLLQPNYTFVPDVKDENVILAWAVGSTSNSNTITLVKDRKLVGNGVGQQDRVGAAKLAIFRADDAAVFAGKEKAELEGATAYSDSFFPFPDAPQVLIDRGIKTIFSTSGSVNDEKIMELCKEKGVNLILLPDKEARGFYQH